MLYLNLDTEQNKFEAAWFTQTYEKNEDEDEEEGWSAACQHMLRIE